MTTEIRSERWRLRIRRLDRRPEVAGGPPALMDRDKGETYLSEVLAELLGSGTETLRRAAQVKDQNRRMSVERI